MRTATNRSRVVIIDDHPPMREGIAAIIGRTRSHEVVGTAGSVREGLSLVREVNPDSVILDISLPDGSGMDLIQTIISELPGTKIMVLTMHARHQLADRAFEAGAHGYLLKESSVEFLVEGLLQIATGERVLDPKLASPEPAEGCVDAEALPESILGRLSSRELEVFRRLAMGQTGKQIANVLGISRKTVDNHRAHIMQKLSIGSVAQLVRIAIRTGAIEP